MPERDLYDGSAVTTIEEAIDSALFNISFREGFSKYKDPELCPVDFLSMLAIEHGVTVWYHGEAEADQRNLIKNAKDIHRKAGTIKGITDAIKSLNLDCVIVPSAIPYQLTITSAALLTPEITTRLRERIEYVKSERDTVFIENTIKTNSKRYRILPTLIRVSVYTKSQFTD